MPDFRSLPKVDALSRDERLRHYPERVRVQAARVAVERARLEVGAGRAARAEDLAVSEAEALMGFSMQSAINASGVILHTGLGRARLAPSVVEHLTAVASGHSVVEYDLQSGARGDRQEHVRAMLCALTGAEDAMVVNNAAAGVLLTLTALARGADVVLSRGQMVEIGGSFRIPDVVRQSGCSLVEVGCTNKTRLSDYEEVVDFDTGAILRCHTSNFKIIGFTSQPTLEELVQLGSEWHVPVIDDQGTGCLVDTARYGIASQPTVQDSISGGATVAIASCDKLLGGPQAGMIVGSASAIADIKRHPLARAVRVDKLTLAALEATLKLYVQGREREIPTLKYLSRPIEEVRQLAERMAACVRNSVVEEGETEIGGGSAPGTSVATYRLGFSTENADDVARALRTGDPPIVGRIESGRVWLDPRTLEDNEVEIVLCRLKSLNC
ncbi:MAG: L-seryl-tRNA(Sec) selenium transferase [Fimbriimonas sp.]